MRIIKCPYCKRMVKAKRWNQKLCGNKRCRRTYQANWERDKYRAKAMSQYVISTNQERRRKI